MRLSYPPCCVWTDGICEALAILMVFLVLGTASREVGSKSRRPAIRSSCPNTPGVLASGEDAVSKRVLRPLGILQTARRIRQANCRAAGGPQALRFLCALPGPNRKFRCKGPGWKFRCTGYTRGNTILDVAWDISFSPQTEAALLKFRFCSVQLHATLEQSQIGIGTSVGWAKLCTSPRRHFCAELVSARASRDPQLSASG